MKSLLVFLSAIWLVVGCFGQNSAAPTADSVRARLIRFSGTLRDSFGKPVTRAAGVTFALYADQAGGAPVWLETQTVQGDEQGRYTVLLGSSKAEGMPAGLFSGDGERWLAVRAEGQEEQARILLVSVPYALHAEDARTVGGMTPQQIVAAATPLVVQNSVPPDGTTTVQGRPSRGTQPAPTSPGAPGPRVSFFLKNSTQGVVEAYNDGTSTPLQLLLNPLGGNVGVGTTAPGQKLSVAGAIESTTGGFKFPDASTQFTAGISQSGADLRYARIGAGNTFMGTQTIQGRVSVSNSETGGSGIFASGDSVGLWGLGQEGVRGDTSSTTGTAVLGVSNDHTTGGTGVSGVSFAPGGIGVQGENFASSGMPIGVYGESPNAGIGVFGFAPTAISGESNLIGGSGVALAGLIHSATGTVLKLNSESTSAYLVEGFSGPTNPSLVFSVTGTGLVFGRAASFNTSGATTALAGNSDSGAGVAGVSTSTYGVYGSSSTGFGVYGSSVNSSGVQGSSGTSYGVYGNSGTSVGVFGDSGNVGVLGHNTTASGGNYAYLSSNCCAADLYGTVAVHGTLTKAAGSFKIDHPLDPENKYLSHSFVESPDMKNIYDGVVISDSSGIADVTLPGWFMSLNKDFRYQLTVIGVFAQAIVEQEITDNHFRIRTDQPNVKVSWQVTGIRHDAYATAHPIPVEEDKPVAEKGSYQFPELYGQPAAKSLRAVRHAESQSGGKGETISR